MLVNKIKLSKSLLVFTIFISVSYMSVAPIMAMESGKSSILTLLNNATRRGLELFSPTTQDSLYGNSQNTKISQDIVNLINEVKRGMPQFPEVEIKKMSDSAAYQVAQEYRFIGIAPTNKTLYVDEKYFKNNIFNQSETVQKIIIKSALEHYLNGTYSIVRSSRFVTGSLAATGAGYFSNTIFNNLRHYIFGTSLEEDVCWYNPVTVLNQPGQAVKSFGMSAFKVFIGGYLWYKGYQGLHGALDFPTKKYLEYKEKRFDKKAIVANGNKINIEKENAMNLIASASNGDLRDAVLLSRAKTIFDENTLNEAEQGIQKEKEQVKTIMAGTKKEFGVLKKQRNQLAVMQFMVSIGGKAAQHPIRIQTELQTQINMFIEKEVVPFYNSSLSKE